MPFFTSKFSPKKSKIRKSTLSLTNEDLEELIHDNRTVKLQLGDSSAYFQNGTWRIDGIDHTYKGNQKLKTKVQELEEENNLLKLKLEILLNMLTKATAERLHPTELKLRKNEASV
ncbi:hypothetical protein RN001_014246 [Aquatica leii]|uniref:Uncharacterized protein n=1 Tax=Aquatica leii TaxID=1421715 RepID=A0AAN7P407_9COLE|nr:hypothetical protein RN001_014246 [Aquatica leii]